MEDNKTRELKCPHCGSVDDYLRNEGDFISCTDCRCMFEDKENNMDWKDLDSKCSIEVLTNNNKYQISMIVNGKHSVLYNKDIDDKMFLFDLLVKGKLFYKLKPLKSIRITRELEILLYNVKTNEMIKHCKDSGKWGDGTLLMLNGRKVEIIGDDE